MTAYKIRYSPEFLEKTTDIFDFIDKDSTSTATGVKQNIFRSINNLSEFPHIGHIGSDKNTLELSISNLPYIVVYNVDDKKDEVHILTVWHCAQSRN